MSLIISIFALFVMFILSFMFLVNFIEVLIRILNDILTWRLLNVPSSFIFILVSEGSVLAWSCISQGGLFHFLVFKPWCLISVVLVFGVETCIVFDDVCAEVISLNQKRSVPYLCVDLNHFVLIFSCFFLLFLLEKFNFLKGYFS